MDVRRWIVYCTVCVMLPHETFWPRAPQALSGPAYSTYYVIDSA